MGKPWSPLKAAILAGVLTLILVSIIGTINLDTGPTFSTAFASGDRRGQQMAPLIMGIPGGVALLVYFWVKKNRDRS